MLLTELFDKPVDLKWKKVGSTVNVSGRIGDQQLNLFFGNIDRIDDVWVISFSMNMKQGITRSGLGMQVFSAVAQAADQWLKDTNPAWITWTADAEEPSRVKLYRRLAKRAETQGWVDVTRFPDIWPEEVAERYTVAEEQTVLVRRDIYQRLVAELRKPE